MREVGPHTTMGIIFAVLLSITVLAGAARLLTAGPLPAKLDAVTLTVAALAPASLIGAWPVDWAPYLALACAALWFLWRVVAPRTAGQGTAGAGRGAAFYRLLFTGAAAWITVSLASSHALGPGGQLGGILLHTIAAVALVFAAAAWLLVTFALPQESAPKDSAPQDSAPRYSTGGKIHPAVGLHEALVAGVVALCFFALV
ncbi:hypothetical protein [Arthrobacter sp. AQ5-05]|uniref:hypothetical protein n=1 Tax=Arthrobacter sp. AQ5-05 TaxID=2184581 RepID=UPI0012B65627|nr:hypothetical protein [Arthrobacter sp. AQ5-05]